MSCDKKEEGCWTEWKAKRYQVKVGANSDLTSSAITVTLKCLAGDTVELALLSQFKPQDSMAVYFNGVRRHAPIKSGRHGSTHMSVRT